MWFHESSVHCLSSLTLTHCCLVLQLQCYGFHIRFLLIHVIPNYTEFHLSTLSQLQRALQPSTDGLGSYYIVLSCLNACHKDFPTLKQLLCVSQPLFLAGHFLCTVLIWAVSGWPFARVGFFCLFVFHFSLSTCVWFTRSYMGIECWTSSRGRLHSQSVLQPSPGVIRLLNVSVVKCLSYLWFDVELILSYWLYKMFSCDLQWWQVAYVKIYWQQFNSQCL